MIAYGKSVYPSAEEAGLVADQICVQSGTSNALGTKDRYRSTVMGIPTVRFVNWGGPMETHSVTSHASHIAWHGTHRH